MRFDPDRHHRRSIRLRGYDYTQVGAYFVTICGIHRECVFGEIRRGKMILSEYGHIADECWICLPQHFPNVGLDEYALLPNHIHGILVITARGVGGVGAQHAAPLPNAPHPILPPYSRSSLPEPIQPGSLSAIIRSYKSAVTKSINDARGTSGNRVFQRNYYERIINSEGELKAIAKYIRDNPRNWLKDPDNPVKL